MALRDYREFVSWTIVTRTFVTTNFVTLTFVETFDFNVMTALKTEVCNQPFRIKNLYWLVGGGRNLDCCSPKRLSGICILDYCYSGICDYEFCDFDVCGHVSLPRYFLTLTFMSALKTEVCNQPFRIKNLYTNFPFIMIIKSAFFL